MKEYRMHRKGVNTPFDVFEPAEGHFERFRLKLDARLHTSPGLNRSNKKKFFMLAAASMVLFLGLNLWLNRSFEKPEILAETQSLLQQNTQLGNLVAKQIKQFTSTADSAQKELIENTMQDLKKMEENYRHLLEVYQSNPNEKVLNALIQNLKKRIEILENLKEKLQLIENLKKNEKSVS